MKRKEKMFLYWRFTSLAVISIFLLAFGRISCMPIHNKLLDYAKKPLTSDEAVQIQNLLKAALEELTDDHVLLVLKRSLLLYFKVCLHPYPAANRENLPGPEGAMEDEHSSPTHTSKDKLRDILLESIDSVNPEKTLDFLKSSVQFRLRYCFSPSYNVSGPISSPEEPPTLPLMPSTQKTSTKVMEILNVETSRDYAQETATNKAVNDASEVSHESETTQTDEIENILSIITELNAKSESSVDEIPSAQNINTANDSPGKPFKPVAVQEISEAKNQEAKSQEKESSLEVPKPQTHSLASSTENKPSQVDIVLKNSAASFAENPHGEKKLNGLPPTKAKIKLEKTDPNEKLSETLVDNTNTVVQAEPEHANEYSVVETSERVGKAELQGNSNEGEFSSVTKINYNEVTIEDQRPEVIDVDGVFDV
ncbi:PREDICTED: uncharacterized protein LOC107329672 [Acropora digitifera]|uniref:uncharacterized protein LOC107329672 n=1 Tax=Acropora digitifera TaxID=70779 RepID=UPI00077AE5A2|nr:PREDICTED: uncharacterized protein LOC107329672 [Acropora digitifera]